MTYLQGFGSGNFLYIFHLPHGELEQDSICPLKDPQSLPPFEGLQEYFFYCTPVYMGIFNGFLLRVTLDYRKILP